ncbi:hypothetical protein SLS56_010220 [Neofusicoccum ribis]|uniref:Cytochrome P450 monooxygenase n=1 Tax=Neofusicoccum ribis TaxID=45134 RepID=A0ABR3SF77_9PEZI
MAQLGVAACAAVTALLAAVYRFLIHPIFLSALAKIPAAHFSSHVSNIWLLWVRYSGQENRAVYELHKRKGPILRLSPNQLSLNCFDGGLKQIYLGGFPKSEFYPNGFHNYGFVAGCLGMVMCTVLIKQSTLPMFAMTNNAEHGARKRLFSGIYSKSHLVSSRAVQEVTKVVLFERLLALLKEESTKSNAVDIVELNYAYSMDSFVNWQFGLQSGCNLINDEAERKMYLKGFFDRERYAFPATELAGVTSVLEKFGIRLVPKYVDNGTRDIEQWNIGMCDKAEEVLRTTNEDTPLMERATVFAQALRTMSEPANETNLDKPSEKYANRNEIACEMFSASSAAHETSGNTLTYAYYELSRRPQLQAQLRKELLALNPPLWLHEGGKLPPAKDLLALPLLNAILMETLRLYPSVPGPQSRVTPHARNSLGGHHDIPAGVTVQCYAYSLHRNADVFPDPEAWKPERWLDASPAELTAVRKWFWAFGSGPSMCIGSNFAMYCEPFSYLISLQVLANCYASLPAMTSALAGVYTNFTTIIHEHGDMELMNSYLAGPKDGKLLLKFHPCIASSE